MKLVGLEPGRTYRLESFEGEAFGPLTGAVLMDGGLTLTGKPEESSWLLRLS